MSWTAWGNSIQLQSQYTTSYNTITQTVHYKATILLTYRCKHSHHNKLIVWWGHCIIVVLINPFVQFSQFAFAQFFFLCGDTLPITWVPTIFLRFPSQNKNWPSALVLSGQTGQQVLVALMVVKYVKMMRHRHRPVDEPLIPASQWRLRFVSLADVEARWGNPPTFR